MALVVVFVQVTHALPSALGHLLGSSSATAGEVAALKGADDEGKCFEAQMVCRSAVDSLWGVIARLGLICGQVSLWQRH
jgi:hypothetical protein